MPAADWVHPVTDPARVAQSNVVQIMTIMCVFFAIGFAFVALRLYSRVKIVRSAGWDDFFIALAEICSLIALIMFFLQIPQGLGHHRDTLTEKQDREYYRLSFGHSLNTLVWSFAFVKFSIGLCLLRLYMGVGGWYRWTLWITLALVGIWAVLASISLIFHCNPIARHYDKRLPGTCYPLELYIKFGLASTGYGLATTVMYAILPIPVIWKLNMERRTKIYLSLILSVGWIAVLAGCLTMYYQYSLLHEKDNMFHASYQVWVYVQLNLGISAACAPMLKPFVGKALALATDQSNSSSQDNFMFSISRKNYTPPSRGIDDSLDPVLDQTNRRPDMEQGTELPMTFYRHGSSNSSASDAKIHREQEDSHGTKGIIRTTEFSLT